jgi:flagellar hook assembly protein FlgD
MVDLAVYNIRGQKVKDLTKDSFGKGQHNITWNGKDNNGKSVATGVYFYKLKADKKVINRKMLLMK